MLLYIVTVILSAAAVLSLTAVFSRSVPSFLASSAAGVAALFSFGLFFPGAAALVTVNGFTLSVSAILGFPGAVSLILLRMISLL